MRRILSILLVLATLLTAIAPLLAMAPQSVPACCRAGGKHHCNAGMMMRGSGFGAQISPCPYAHRLALMPVLSGVIVASRSNGLLYAGSQSIDHIQPHFQFCRSNEVYERGPPST